MHRNTYIVLLYANFETIEMNDDQRRRMEKILNQGYEFRFGEYISEGFSIFQQYAGGFIGFALVAGIITTIANFIPFIGPLVNNLILTPCLTVGFYLVAHKIKKEEQPEFGYFFKGFDYVGQLAIAVLIIGLLILVSLIPFFIVAGTSGLLEWLAESQEILVELDEPPTLPWWSAILVIPGIYLGIAYVWTSLFIAFYNMNFWDAMEMSRKFISKQWFLFFFFFFVLGLLALSGLILLFVGILITMPIVLCALYASFADVTGLWEEEQADIEDQLVD